MISCYQKSKCSVCECLVQLKPKIVVPTVCHLGQIVTFLRFFKNNIQIWRPQCHTSGCFTLSTCLLILQLSSNVRRRTVSCYCLMTIAKSSWPVTTVSTTLAIKMWVSVLCFLKVPIPRLSPNLFLPTSSQDRHDRQSVRRICSPLWSEHDKRRTRPAQRRAALHRQRQISIDRVKMSNENAYSAQNRVCELSVRTDLRLYNQFGKRAIQWNANWTALRFRKESGASLSSNAAQQTAQYNSSKRYEQIGQFKLRI